MNPMDTNRGAEAAGGTNQRSQGKGFQQRRSDRRGEGGLFGYEGPDRRSGRDRRQAEAP